MLDKSTPVKWFAQKYVSRLSSYDSTVWDAIELMYDLNERYIPIVDGIDIAGIVDPISILMELSRNMSESFFNQPVMSCARRAYLSITSDDMLIDIIKILVQEQKPALLVDGFMINGILTVEDLIEHNYLWNGHDEKLISELDIGSTIDSFNSIPGQSMVSDVIKQMDLNNSSVTVIVDSTTGDFISTIDIIIMIRYLMSYNQIHDYSWKGVFKERIENIFPSSAMYIRHPETILDLRNDLVDSDCYHAILLDEDSFPEKVITRYDLAKFLVDHL